MEIKQSKDVCIDKLTSTTGVDLEITANLTSQGQIAAVLQGYVCAALNSRYGVAQYQMLLRLTDSWRGRCRDDLTGIGKVPEVQGWTQGPDQL
jgi:hypothetical protein